MRSLLPIEQATATAWIIGSGSKTEVVHNGVRSPGRTPLGTFDVSLHSAAATSDNVPPSWLPLPWGTNGSAQSFAVLALLADGRGSCEFALGTQRVSVTIANGVTEC
jgi:hypothetical protein